MIELISLPLLGPPALMPSRASELARAIAGFAATHVPLVAVDQGQLRAVGGSDDAGLFLLGSVAARHFGVGPDGAAAIVLGTLLLVALVAGLLALPRLVTTSVGRVIGSVALVGSALVAWGVGDVYIASAAAVLGVVPYAATLHTRRSAVAVPTLLAAGVLLGIANVLRSQASLPVFVLLAVVILTRLPWSRLARVAALAALVVGSVIPALGYRAVQARRDAWLAERVPGYTAPLGAHPFWHTAYIGFGFLGNDLGIAYRDEVAVARVRALDPAAAYVSPRYEAALRGEVFRLVREQPGFVLRTEAAKAGVLALLLGLFMNVGLLALARCPGRLREHLSYWAALVAASLPGFIALPSLPYLLAFTSLAAIYGAVRVDAAFQSKATATS